MPTEKEILAKITNHEKAVVTITDKTRAAMSKLHFELNGALDVLANFEALPTEASVPLALAAQSTSDNAKELIALLGPRDRREAVLCDAYVTQNASDLLRLLESLQAIRTAPRDAFRKDLAAKLAPLHAALSLNLEDWTALKQVEALEAKLNDPEFSMSRAAEALRDFRATPTHSHFVNAHQAMMLIEFPSL